MTIRKKQRVKLQCFFLIKKKADKIGPLKLVWFEKIQPLDKEVKKKTGEYYHRRLKKNKHCMVAAKGHNSETGKIKQPKIR